MKKLGFFICIILAYYAKADHILGADITYKCIDTNIGKYRFRVSLYRDCSGIAYSSENLEIRKTGFSGTVPLVFKYKEDVTNLCQVPDVATNPVTNCIDTSSLIKGVERYVYEVDYVVGKNIGFAYVAWTKCCRSSKISTILYQDSSLFWVQSLINTSFINNSPVFINSPFPAWCKLTKGTYNIGAVDSIDENMIWVNGQFVKQDSIVYKLYKPFVGERIGNLDLSNPTIIFNSTLNENDFLYTTNGIQFEPKTGNLFSTSSQIQDAILAIVVLEYRAIPNSNGIGYSRVLTGYISRDISFSVSELCSPLFYNGTKLDGNSKLENNSEFQVKTNKLIGNKFQFKVIGNSQFQIMFKDNVLINKNLISNYKVSNYIQASKIGTDTFIVNVEFDFVNNCKLYEFNYTIYNCNYLGMKYELPMNFIVRYDKFVTIPEASISSIEKNKYWVYPTIINNNESLQIQVFNPKFNLCLYAFDGRKLQEWSNQKTIQLNQISKGNYLLKLESENENLSQKIIVE